MLLSIQMAWLLLLDGEQEEYDDGDDDDDAWFVMPMTTKMI